VALIFNREFATGRQADPGCAVEGSAPTDLDVLTRGLRSALDQRMGHNLLRRHSEPSLPPRRPSPEPAWCLSASAMTTSP
jgi:hypothetical protein